MHEPVDWAALRHAYGSAEDVPRMLGGLISEDDATREEALDSFYGAVHHQGDIYDSTVAAIPFLVDMLGMQVPGRAEVLGLIASIGKSARAANQLQDLRASHGLDPVSEDVVRLRYEALSVLRARADDLLAMLADEDAHVRREAPDAIRCLDSARVEAALRAQLEKEGDREAQEAQIATLLELMRAAPGRVGELTQWLRALAKTSTEPALQLRAYVSLLELAPDERARTFASARGLLHALYERPGVPTTPDEGAGTDTLMGRLRRLEASVRSGRRAPDAGRWVHQLSSALGDDVTARRAFLLELLRSSNWEQQGDALGPLSGVIANWRGDYAEVATQLGTMLGVVTPRLEQRVAQQLNDMFELAAPAADALVAAMNAAPRSGERSDVGPAPWLITWGNGEASCGEVLIALSRIGDVRLLPAVQWLFEQPVLAKDAGYLLGALGANAKSLVPLLARRFDALVGSRDAALYGLTYACRELGPDAVPALDALMRHAQDDVWSLPTLGALGPAGARAVPMLKAFIERGEVRAAQALWKIAPQAMALGPFFVAQLGSKAASEAAIGLGMMGAAAQPWARQLLERRDGESPDFALAWLEITGEVAPVADELRLLWPQLWAKQRIADASARHSNLANALKAELQQEVRAVRRHNASETGSSSHQVDTDERLLRACRAALAEWK